jgi:hypothetical protein
MPKPPITRVSAMDIIPVRSNKNNGLYAPALTTTERDAIPATTRRNGLIIYNTTTNLFNVYEGGAWKALEASADANGNIIVNSYTTANAPAAPVNGMIYYDTTTNQYTAYLNGAWTVLYSTTNLAGNAVVKVYLNEAALPGGVNGMIAYQTTGNLFKGYNGAWRPFYQTTNVDGVFIVTVVADENALPDPAAEGMLVYQNDINALKVYQGAAWAIIYGNISAATGTGLTAGNNPFTLPSGTSAAVEDVGAGNLVNGFVYNNTTANNVRGRVNGAWTTILSTTSAATGTGLAAGNTPVTLPSGTRAAVEDVGAGNLVNGFIYYDSTNNVLRSRVNGAWVTVQTA